MALTTMASPGAGATLPPGVPLGRSAHPFRPRMPSLVIERETEGRQSPRRPLRCELSLIGGARGPDGERAAIPAECCNIGHGGLYAIVPIGYGVAIGQRYTFELSVGERGPEPGAVHKVSQQGEIVRAELLLGEDGHADRVGIAVRLFGPRCGLVPMPTMV